MIFMASGAEDFRLTTGGGSAISAVLNPVGNTTTPLLANIQFLSASFQTAGNAIIKVICDTDQVGTIAVQQSPDNVNFRDTRTLTLQPNELNAFEVDVVSPYARINLINGGTNQTILRLYWYTSTL